MHAEISSERRKGKKDFEKTVVAIRIEEFARARDCSNTQYVRERAITAALATEANGEAEERRATHRQEPIDRARLHEQANGVNPTSRK